MCATYALQLQEVSIFLVAKEKGISLQMKNVERILKRKKNKNESTFDAQYKAFAKEVECLYGVKIPSLAMWLRKMRQAVLHEGYNPTEKERKLAVSATIQLLKELKKVHYTETKDNVDVLPK
jgi:intein/homing endonuclease